MVETTEIKDNKPNWLMPENLNKIYFDLFYYYTDREGIGKQNQ